MLKIFEPSSWSTLVSSEESVSLVKFASTGLKGSDLKNLEKRAGDEFAYKTASLPPPDGEEYVHVIALGSYEAYGPNRKGDAFPEDVCRRYHDTFRKYGRWYREHIHNDPARSYGVVKLSAYNEKMRRIDLIVALNATPKACEKNGGLIADEELMRLYSGDTISVSMACRVSYDICSGCGDKARTLSEYCTERTCVKYGGRKTNLGKIFEDGHILCSINPDPTFFDISYVRVPADRTAHSIGILKQSVNPLLAVSDDYIVQLYKTPDDFRKSAASFFSSIYRRPDVMDSFVRLKNKLLDKLSSMEKEIRPRDEFRFYFQEKNVPIKFPNPKELLRKAAGHRCLIPPAVFAVNFLNKKDGFSAIRNFDTSDIFSLLSTDKNLLEKLSSCEYLVQPDFDEFEFSTDWTLNPQVLHRNITNSLLKQANKQPKQNTAVVSIDAAREYALYQLDLILSQGMIHDGYLKTIVQVNKSWN